MEEKHKEQESQLPLNIGQCPNCGGTRRIANEVLQEQIKKGRMKKDTKAFLYNHQSIIAGPVGTWLSAPMVISFYDVCMDCGTVYCVNAQVKTAMQGGKMPQAGNQFSTS